MRINNNISALRANTNLSRVEKRLDKSTRRLSSGYKLNPLSVLHKMRQTGFRLCRLLKELLMK